MTLDDCRRFHAQEMRFAASLTSPAGYGGCDLFLRQWRDPELESQMRKALATGEILKLKDVRRDSHD